MNSNSEKKSLLKKYGIPIERLDFEYIKTTTNVKELEKICKILKSGEEGYFPDLTNCAEERIRVLCPGNRLLRTEEPLRTKDGIDRHEWNSISSEIKVKDNYLFIQLCNKQVFLKINELYFLELGK